jgi:hypothetical protein
MNNDKAGKDGVKGESYDFSKDFQLLPRKERRDLVENAKTLLKLQRDNALLANAESPALSNEAGRQKIV